MGRWTLLLLLSNLNPSNRFELQKSEQLMGGRLGGGVPELDGHKDHLTAHLYLLRFWIFEDLIALLFFSKRKKISRRLRLYLIICMMAWSVIVGIWEITSDLITLTKADRRNRETILKRYGIQWHNSEFGGLINYFHDYEWFAPNLQSNTQISLSYSSHLKKSKGIFAMWIKFSAKIQEDQNLPAIFLWNCPLPLRSCLYTRLLQFLRATKLSYKNKNNLYL